MSIGGVSNTPKEIDGVPVIPKGQNSDLDRNAFLKLLTVQLGNQDPLNPISNENFIAQQATFSQLEQQVSLNEKIDKFLERQETVFSGINSVFSNMQGAGFLGKEVEFASDKAVIKGGEVNQLYFSAADTGNIGYTVRNESNNIVRTVSSKPVQKGQVNSIEFDGKDSFGQKLPEGAYKIELSGTNTKGEPLSGTSFAKREVRSVDFRGTLPLLKLESGESVTLDKVLSINEEVTT